MNSTSRPEQEDVYGLRHPYLCPSRITVRPAFLKPHHVYVRCLDCGALGLVPDVGTNADTNVGTNADTGQ